MSAMAMAGFYRRVLPSPPAVDFGSSQGKQLFREAIQNGNMEGFPRLVSCFQTQSKLGFCGLASLSMVLNALAIDPRRQWKGPWRWFDEYMLDYCEPLDKIKTKGISFPNLVSLAHCTGAKVVFISCKHESWNSIAKFLIDDVPSLLKSEDVKDICKVLSVIVTSLPSNFEEFIKWVTEIRRQEDDGPSLSEEEKTRAIVKEEILKQVQRTRLFEHVASFLSHFSTTKSIGMHPTSIVVLTMLLLSLPSTTWDGITDKKLLRDIHGLVSIENFPTLLQEEVLHVRRQLHRCQEWGSWSTFVLAAPSFLRLSLRTRVSHF